MGKKVYIEGAGCTRRKMELARIAVYLKENGYTVVKSPNAADHIIAATCAFKKSEVVDSLDRINRLQKYDSKFLVFGCLPNIHPSFYKEHFEAEYVSPKNLGDISKHFATINVPFNEVKDVDNVPDFIDSSSIGVAGRKFVKKFELSRSFTKRVARFAEKKIKAALQANQKVHNLYVAKGCASACSYCGIRHAVGVLQSKPPAQIIQEFRNAHQRGFRRFHIVADDVGAYGIDVDQTYTQLMGCLVREAERLEGSTNEGVKADEIVTFTVEEMNPRWMLQYREEFFEQNIIARLFEILMPVQSGNSRILKLMKRHYTAEAVIPLTRAIRAANSDVRITTQVIVGFPSESEDAFRDTLSCVKDCRFDSVTVFPYDEKENTAAVSIEPKVSQHDIERRVEEVLKFCAKNRIASKLSCA